MKMLRYFTIPISISSRVTPRSFLIDAGVACQGYASDITRTYAYDQGSDFAAMIKQMDKVQQELVALGAIGQCPLELHVQSQHKVAQVLIDFKLLKGSPDQAVEQDIVSSFYPHGLEDITLVVMSMTRAVSLLIRETLFQPLRLTLI